MAWFIMENTTNREHELLLNEEMVAYWETRHEMFKDILVKGDNKNEN